MKSNLSFPIKLFFTAFLFLVLNFTSVNALSPIQKKHVSSIKSQTSKTNIVYKIIEKPVPGPQGPAGKDGRDGYTGQTAVTNYSGQGQFNGYLPSGTGPGTGITNGGSGSVSDLSVTGNANLNSLVSGSATFTNLTVTGTTKITNLSLTQVIASAINSIVGTFVNLYTDKLEVRVSNASTTNASTSNAITFNGTTGNISTLNSITNNSQNLLVTGTATITNLNVSADILASGKIGTNGITGGFQIDGYDVLTSSTSLGNLYVGLSAGNAYASGTSNTAVGGAAMYSLTSGFNNTAIGQGALALTDTGSDNVALGISAGGSNTTGIGNIAIGSFTQFASSTGNYQLNIGNTIFGDLLYGRIGLGTTTFPQQLTLSGSMELPNTLTGNFAGIIYKNGSPFIHDFHDASSTGYNTFVGQNSGNLYMSPFGGDASAASLNTAVGAETLLSNQNGESNTAGGALALRSNISGVFNSAFGTDALLSNFNGANNTAGGAESLYSNFTGSGNSAYGVSTLLNNIDGENNTAVGMEALFSNISGIQNTGLGFNSLYDNTTGDGNTGIGVFALSSNQKGTGNTAIGAESFALLDNLNGEGYNTAIGYNTGKGIVTGKNNTIIGANVKDLSATLSNNVIIADGSGNQRINIDANGNVGLGITNPSYKLDISGQLRATGLYLRSDEKLKKIITPLASTTEVQIAALKPVSYEWLDPSFGTTTQIGFIAQDVQKVYPNLVTQEDSGLLSVNYLGLIAPIVKVYQGVISITGSFKNNLIAWLGSGDNGIVKMRADKYCASTTAGSENCISGDQLAEIISLLNNRGSTNSVSAPPVIPVSTSTTPTSTTTDPVVDNSTTSTSTASTWVDPIDSSSGTNTATSTLQN